MCGCPLICKCGAGGFKFPQTRIIAPKMSQNFMDHTGKLEHYTQHNCPPTSLTYHTIWPETDIPARYLLICEGKLPSGSIRWMCEHAVYRCRCCCRLVFVCWVWPMVRPPFSRTGDCLLEFSRDHLLRRNARCCR